MKVYKQLKASCAPDAFFLTNTSSIPIGLLDERRGARRADRRLPLLQSAARCRSWSRSSAARGRGTTSRRPRPQLGKRLGKTLIPSHDVAGFIGNGHFIRDGLHGIAEVSALAKTHGCGQAAYMVNRVSQDWLVRPMGIFQLIDYVGVDVFQFIQDVMDRFIEGEKLQDPTDRRP